MEKYEKIKGKKLCKVEKILVSMFGEDARYEIYKDNRGMLAAKVI